MPGFPLPLDESLIGANDKTLVAVSGGADSMALLAALIASGFDLVVAHVNHGLRGPDSDGDEAFVIQRCGQLGIPALTRRVEVPRGEDDWAGEAAARTVRYSALSEMAAQSGCSLVATGHTADDFLETILINLIRGSGPEGSAGIPRRRPLSADLSVVRPLWKCTRSEVRSACVQAGWAWREDESNGDPKYLRNRLRLEVLPLLADMTRGGIEQLARQTARNATALRDELDFIADATREGLKQVYINAEEGRLILDGFRYRELPTAMQRRALREAADRVSTSRCNAGFELVEEARRQIVNDGRHAVWCWPGGVRVEWTGAMAGNRVRVWLVDES